MLLTLLLIFRAFGQNYFLYSILFLALGALSVYAAMKYTMGDSAYGYRGLGDIFVFSQEPTVDKLYQISSFLI